jgi:hypothetical protein
LATPDALTAVKALFQCDRAMVCTSATCGSVITLEYLGIRCAAGRPLITSACASFKVTLFTDVGLGSNTAELPAGGAGSGANALPLDPWQCMQYLA